MCILCCYQIILLSVLGLFTLHKFCVLGFFGLFQIITWVVFLFYSLMDTSAHVIIRIIYKYQFLILWNEVSIINLGFVLSVMGSTKTLWNR